MKLSLAMMLIGLASADDNPIPDGVSWKFDTDTTDSSKIRIEVNTPANTWFGLGFGEGMENTDMLMF